MKLSARILLKIRDFFRKYWGIILTVAIVWIALIIINNYLKNLPEEIEVINTYTPDTSVLDDTDTVSSKEATEINELIETYFNYCNNKEYSSAYNLLTEDCKSYLYGNSVGNFKEYVDGIFTTNKIYNIQNYSNVDDVYIYNIRILDDIMSTGTTGGYDTYQEKIAIITEDGTKKISNQGYMGKEVFSNVVGEDDYMKVKILYKNMSYSREEYYIEITNKTDDYILIANGSTTNEITLNLGDQTRAALDVINSNVYLEPGETEGFYILFDKYYDDGSDPSEISFNLVRVYEDEELVAEGSSGDAIKAYSVNISFE